MLRSFIPLLLLMGAQLAGCQTYRDDLNRGQRYYEDNQYAQALALFRALERDTDSLSAHEQARYAYFRGMTDFRLARVEGGNDERFDRHARYWLGLASAIEKDNPGGLQEHEKKRLGETLSELNAKAFGIASRFASSGSTAEESSTLPRSLPAAAPGDPGLDAPPSSPSQGPAPKQCTASSDCPTDQICQDGSCVKL